jgi:cardiolipin synthase
MFKDVKAQDWLTIPNILSFFRIVLIVPFVYFFLEKNYVLAAVMLILSGLSDACDGFIARKFNQVTELGKMLDPIADKLTLIAIMVCITIFSPIVLPVMIVLIVKDVIMIIGGSRLVKTGIAPPAAKWYGKLGTFMFYVSVCLIVFLKAAFNYENDILSVTLLSITSVIMIFALIKYFLVYNSLLKESGKKVKE